MVTLDDIKREAIAVMTRDEPLDGYLECHSLVKDVIDHLHSQGLLMVRNTDMDSAPRDGTPVLLLCEKIEPEVGNNYQPNYPVKAYFSFGHWYVEDSTYYVSEAINPTAWMPLPKWKDGTK